MKTVDIVKIVILILFLASFSFTIYLLIKAGKDNDLYDTTPVLVNPKTGSQKVNCTQIRTPCTVDSDCKNSCNEDELSCVNLGSDGAGFNGGQSVCLPAVDIKCDSDKGGVLVWTGYSAVGKQEWSCLCQYPDRFNGPDCSTISPGYCSGGTIDTSNLNGNYPGNDRCNCPMGTTKVISSSTSLPFCAISSTSSIFPQNLLGNISPFPSWKNIYFNMDGNFKDWLNMIIKSVFFINYSKLTDTDKNNLLFNLESIIPANSLKLNSNMISRICTISNDPKIVTSGTKPDINMCKGNIPLNPPTDTEMNQIIYTYYDNTEFTEEILKTFLTWSFWQFNDSNKTIFKVVNIDTANKKFDLQSIYDNLRVINCTYDDTGNISYNFPNYAVCSSETPNSDNVYYISNCKGSVFTFTPFLGKTFLTFSYWQSNDPNNTIFMVQNKDEKAKSFNLQPLQGNMDVEINCTYDAVGNTTFNSKSWGTCTSGIPTSNGTYSVKCQTFNVEFTPFFGIPSTPTRISTNP